LIKRYGIFRYFSRVIKNKWLKKLLNFHIIYQYPIKIKIVSLFESLFTSECWYFFPILSHHDWYWQSMIFGRYFIIMCGIKILFLIFMIGFNFMLLNFFSRCDKLSFYCFYNFIFSYFIFFSIFTKLLICIIKFFYCSFIYEIFKFSLIHWENSFEWIGLFIFEKFFIINLFVDCSNWISTRHIFIICWI
jgi:hypothetical protein